MSNTKNLDRSVRKFIHITDSNNWELIDKLTKLPKYSKSFNKIINDALDYGLPKLVEVEIGKKIELEEGGKSDNPLPQFVEVVSDRRVEELIRLNKEMVLNAFLCKSMLSSLFNQKCYELKGTKIEESFANGDLRDTPSYLEDYEMSKLKNLVEEDDE